ncbi:MAG: hypothetical protein KI790_17650 [Cyclobacteriaceae bacterium]|nr:hypothetical protein [Cyclobacteriaceae bacterium HetDA_MAG_MS6]
MPWNLLLIPLAGGYYILTRFIPLRYKQQRLDRQRLVFGSVLLGLLSISLTFACRYLISIYNLQVIDTLYRYVPIKIPFLGTTIASLVLTIIWVELMNVAIFRNREVWVRRAIKSVGNEFELLLVHAVEESKLVEFTLENNKFYIGWIKELPIPSISSYIRIYPYVSGYRDEHKQFNFTTDYSSVYAGYIEREEIQNIDELDVDLIIPISRIMSASYFDLEMFERFSDIQKK